MAHSHLEVGIASPFLVSSVICNLNPHWQLMFGLTPQYTPRPHTHPTLESLRSALRAIGNRIAQDGTPPSLGPFVIGLTGYVFCPITCAISYLSTRTGNVSQGCLSMLEELPIDKVSVKDLHALVTNKGTLAEHSQTIQPQPSHALSNGFTKGAFPEPQLAHRLTPCTDLPRPRPP